MVGYEEKKKESNNRLGRKERRTLWYMKKRKVTIDYTFKHMLHPNTHPTPKKQRIATYYNLYLSK
jgi:hypothetical protein